MVKADVILKLEELVGDKYPPFIDCNFQHNGRNYCFEASRDGVGKNNYELDIYEVDPKKSKLLYLKSKRPRRPKELQLLEELEAHDLVTSDSFNLLSGSVYNQHKGREFPINTEVCNLEANDRGIQIENQERLLYHYIRLCYDVLMKQDAKTKIYCSGKLVVR